MVKREFHMLSLTLWIPWWKEMQTTNVFTSGVMMEEHEDGEEYDDLAIT